MLKRSNSTAAALETADTRSKQIGASLLDYFVIPVLVHHIRVPLTQPSASYCKVSW